MCDEYNVQLYVYHFKPYHDWEDIRVAINQPFMMKLSKHARFKINNFYSLIEPTENLQTSEWTYEVHQLIFVKRYFMVEITRLKLKLISYKILIYNLYPMSYFIVEIFFKIFIWYRTLNYCILKWVE